MKINLIKRHFHQIVFYCSIFFLLANCNNSKTAKQEVCLVLSGGFQQDSIRIIKNNNLVVKDKVTTDASVGIAYRMGLGEKYGVYKIVVGSRDTFQVNLSELYPVVYVSKDSLALSAKYFQKELILF